nr:hypothetical protein [Tanacetum cinerariifolium]
MPTAGVVIRDTPDVSMSKKKAPAKVMELVPNQSFLLSLETRQLVQIKELVLNQEFLMYPKINLRARTNLGKIVKIMISMMMTVMMSPLTMMMMLSNADGDNEASDNERTDSYKDRNPNLRKIDAEMTDAGGDDVSQEKPYEQVKDDAHVTLTAAHVTRKTEGPMQSFSVSSDFFSQFLNLDNVPPVDNEVVSMMNVKVRHEEPSTQTPSFLTIPVMVIPKTSTTAAPTISLTIPPITPLPQQSTPTPTPTPTTETTKTSIPTLSDFSFLFGFDQRVFVLEKELSQLKQVYYPAQLLENIKS